MPAAGVFEGLDDNWCQLTIRGDSGFALLTQDPWYGAAIASPYRGFKKDYKSSGVLSALTAGKNPPRVGVQNNAKRTDCFLSECKIYVGNATMAASELSEHDLAELSQLIAEESASWDAGPGPRESAVTTTSVALFRSLHFWQLGHRLHESDRLSLQ